MTNEGPGDNLEDGTALWILRILTPIIKADDGFDEIRSSASTSASGETPNSRSRRQRAAEQRIHDATEELKRSNAELRQFAYIASHDLQSPLRSISGFANLLQAECEDHLPPQGKDYLQRITANVSHKQSLIQDLLTYSRVDSQSKDFAQVNLDDVLARAQATLQAQIVESGARLRATSLPVVQGDAVQLQQLFCNLIDNALKYRSDAVPAGAHQRPAQRPLLQIAIEDNGIGIAVKHQNKIFQIFRRLHTQAEYPGTGIGLAICQRIVQRHGGQLWVESDGDKGSVFSFTLPKRTAMNRRLPSQSRPAEVLLVEDSENDVILMQKAFEQSRFAVNFIG